MSLEQSHSEPMELKAYVKLNRYLLIIIELIGHMFSPQGLYFQG